MPLSLTKPSLIAYNGYRAGLGNRVRVVLGCQSLAELEGRDFRYVWPTGRRFGPRFSDLWQVEERLVSRTTSRLLARIYPYEDRTLTWIDDDKRRQRVWQIATGGSIQLPDEATPWQQKLRGLEPVEPIAQRVCRFRAEHLGNEPYIGVMIRSHSVSHQVTLEASPVSWFIDRMNEIRASHSEVRFFISCDSQDVQESIMATIPGCVAQFDKGPYNSTAAVRAGVSDLYLLAGSGYLLGPHFSSFIHLARVLAGERLTMETSVAPTTEVEWTVHGIAPDPLRPALRATAGGRKP